MRACGSLLLYVGLSALISCCLSDEESNAGRTRTLMLVEDLSIPTTHSSLIQTLQKRGHHVSILRADDAKLEVASKSGENLYDNMIIFAPRAEEFGNSLDVSDIMAFVDKGGNLLLASSPDASDYTREMTAECGLEMDEETAYVQDHFQHDAADDGSHTLIIADDIAAPEVMLGTAQIGPVLFRGTGFGISDDNALVFPILSAPSSSYLYQLNQAIRERPVALGASTLLIAAVQARNGARVVVAGSMEIFSDKTLGQQVTRAGSSRRGEPSGNRQLMQGLLAWAFRERGVLRASPLRIRPDESHQSHGHVAGSGEHVRYHVGHSVHVSLDVQQLDAAGTWVPYAADSPVLLELRFLDPLLRIPLLPSPGAPNGTLSATIVLPDQPGMYKLSVSHAPRGFSALALSEEIVVQPLPYGLRPRFLLSAYPYYASAAGMVGAAVLLSLLLLFHQHAPDAPKPAHLKE